MYKSLEFYTSILLDFQNSVPLYSCNHVFTKSWKPGNINICAFVFLEFQNSNLVKKMIISCISYKGGVGKTTLCQNLAVAFAHAKRKVCIIDCDESFNSADWGKERKEKSPQLPVIEVIGEKDEDEFPHLVERLNKEYEVIIIDSPPTQSSISRMAILMSNLVLVPLLPKGAQETNTIAQLMRKVKGLEVTQGRAIPVYFFLNTYNKRIVHMRNFRESMEKAFPGQVLKTTFSELKAYYRAPYFGMGVTEYLSKEDSAENAAQEVKSLVNELVEIISKLK